MGYADICCSSSTRPALSGRSRSHRCFAGQDLLKRMRRTGGCGAVGSSPLAANLEDFGDGDCRKSACETVCKWARGMEGAALTVLSDPSMLSTT